jgi:NADH:ubiquinone oxidoreductase subunit 2 (subunit N)
MFVEVSDINVFMGLSFASVLHMSILLALMPGAVQDILALLLSLYVLLILVLFFTLRTISSKSFQFADFTGFIHTQLPLCVGLVVALFMFLGIPPSVVFILKTNFLASSMMYISVLWGLFALLGVIGGLVYIRLIMVICASSTSERDIVSVSYVGALSVAIAAVSFVLVLVGV